MNWTLLVASTAELRFYQSLVMGLFIAIAILFVVIWLLRVKVRKLKLQVEGEPSPPVKKEEPVKTVTAAPVIPKEQPKASIRPKELPDPGLLFRFSMADENVTEKTINVGQSQGSIKTFSTEIVNDHLNLYIRIIENRRDRDIYDLPKKLSEEYLIDMRRGGKALIFYPGLKSFQEMSSRQRVYIKEEPDETGELTFGKLEPTAPVRFRLGDRLNQDGKFINGFFEFHLFTKDYEVKTKAGIPKIEKLFFLRLYKIYPGYDTGNPNPDGFYPMIDPFTR